MHTGKVIKLGDYIDTDIIIPTEYMTIETIEKMSAYAFYPVRKDIPQIVRKGDILVAGKNFGCGSSREQAPEIIKHLGFHSVIAKSFARIFYRNAINNGLLLIENSDLFDCVNEGDTLTVDTDNLALKLSNGKTIPMKKIPDMLIDMINQGGLVQYYKKINTRMVQE